MNAMTATIPADRVFAPLTDEVTRAWSAVDRAARELDPKAEVRLFVGFSGTIGGTIVSRIFENRPEAETRPLLVERVPEELRDRVGHLTLRAWGERLV